MIRTNKNKETKPDFDEMMIEVKEDIQEQDAEQDIINRVPELKELSGNIDKATNTCANARLGLESAIQQYQRAERKLDDSVTTISGKLDTINEHIDQVMEDAPTKLKVTVTLCDADREKIQEMFGKQREWLINQAQTIVQTVNAMLAEERKKTMNREYTRWRLRAGLWATFHGRVPLFLCNRFACRADNSGTPARFRSKWSPYCS